MLLPDKRLYPVLDKFTDRIREKQTLTMRKLANARKEEIQFGRFLSNDRIKFGHLQSYLYNQLGQSCDSTDILLIQDSSQMGFGLNKAISGLGKVDKGQIQGFYIHPTLCLDAYSGACYGIASLNIYKRTFEQTTKTRKQINAQRTKTPYEYKEGYKWYTGIKDALQNLHHLEQRKTVVADREADIYPLLAGLKNDLQVDYVIRSRFNRAARVGGNVAEIIQSWEPAYSYEIEVPPTDKRSAHKAIMDIKFGEIDIKKSEGKSLKKQPDFLHTWVVEAKESPSSVVCKEAPIEWLLLTSHPVKNIHQALQIITWYKERWNIEQLFRLLKNKGLCFESTQVSSYEKLQKLMALALIGAVKVLQLVRARNNATKQSMSCAFSEQEEKFMLLVNQQVTGKTEKLQNPYPANSLAFAAWVIARLAGWGGYKSQRPAGPIDMLTGLKILYQRMQGYYLLTDT